jgi:hypothetical protein
MGRRPLLLTNTSLIRATEASRQVPSSIRSGICLGSCLMIGGWMPSRRAACALQPSARIREHPVGEASRHIGVITANAAVDSHQHYCLCRSDTGWCVGLTERQSARCSVSGASPSCSPTRLVGEFTENCTKRSCASLTVSVSPCWLPTGCAGARYQSENHSLFGGADLVVREMTE